VGHDGCAVGVSRREGSARSGEPERGRWFPSSQVRHDSEQLFATDAAVPGDFHEVSCSFDHVRARGSAGDVDSSSPAELEEPLFPQGPKCPEDGVAVDSEHGREVNSRRQSIPRSALSLADRATNLGSHLLVKRQGLCRIYLDEGNRTNHNGIMVVRESGTEQVGAVPCPSDSELLIKEAHEHRVKRWKRRGLALLAIGLAGAAAGVGLELGGPSPSSPDNAKGGKVVAAAHHQPLSDFTVVQPGGTGTATAGPGPTQVDAVNAGTGHASTRSLPPEANTHYPWIARGRSVVAVEGTRAGGNDAPLIGNAYAFDPTSTAAPVALGPASFAMAATNRDAVWLFTSSLTENQVFHTTTTGRRCTIEEVTVTGSVLRPQSPFRCGLGITEAVPQGFLIRVSTKGSGHWRYEVWNLSQHRVVRKLPTMTATPIAVQHNATTLLWGTSGGRSQCVQQSACELHIDNIETGHVAIWHVPAGRAVDTYKLEPNSGSEVAVLLVRPKPYLHYLAMTSFSIVLTPQPVAARLLVLDGTTGKVLFSRPVETTFAANLYLTPGGTYAMLAARVTPKSTTGDWVAYPAWSSTAASHTVRVGYDSARALILQR